MFWNGDLGPSRKSAIEIREKVSQKLDFMRKFDWIRGEASQKPDTMRKFDWIKGEARQKPGSKGKFGWNR
ncbi:hypothetical protein P4U90_12220 [Cytobacillus kochii]|uniref:hypothetical protein n=1 Tax=Cytobacillus kochii TaxID=859143 RepID=UPI002E23265A|nr:hypothetical protein [Cytobacillus kochii]